MSVISQKRGRTTQGCGGNCQTNYPNGIKFYKRSYYENGFRFCSGCEISVQIDELRCRCCNQVRRSKPKERRNKRDNRLRM